MDFAQIRTTLERAGVAFEGGLAEADFRRIEDEHAFRFPPDLRQFLMHALPVSKGWINWRRANAEEIRERLGWPYEGICFDIEHNVFWPDEWGERPENLTDAFAVARRFVDEAPKLVPVCGHRFMPDRPCEAGNPVLSVYQTDIIYYGSDLQDYLENEFSYYFGRESYRITGPVRRIEFWSRMVELNE